MNDDRRETPEPLSLLDALEVVRGDAQPEELAALVAVVAAHAAAGGSGPSGPFAPVGRRTPHVRSAWCAPVLRKPLPLGAGAWQAALRRH